MARLPVPGSDKGTWGNVLNDYLNVAHDTTGALKSGSVGTSQITDGTITAAKLSSAVQTSLGKADTALQAAPVTSVAGQTGAVTLAKSDVGLANVDNTSDTNKPVSSAQASAINAKVTNVQNAAGLWSGTQTQYDAIGSPSATTVYIITEA